MFKCWSNIFIVFVLFPYLDALDSEKCKQKPKEKHCLIEWSVRNKWPHEVRYVFDWATSKCFEIRWSQHCPAVPSPPVSNNFPSESECMRECSGWA